MRRNGNVVSTPLSRIATLAKQDKQVKFTSLAHLLTPEYLKDSFHKLNKKGAPGADGMTMEVFEANLDTEIDQLWYELRNGTYRATPVRRKYIPKANGKQRPLGIPTIRDRTAQRAISDILGLIYEPYFCECSYGFRPGRSCHDALERLRTGIERQPIGWVVDVDIKGYFDNVNHRWMLEFLRHRIADKTLLRLISKWLKAGILEDGMVVRSERGTPQGGPLSPLLANIYLHYVLDLWFERKFRPSCTGAVSLVRYADDFVVCFEFKVGAERFLQVLKERFAQFHLEVSEEKTKQVKFGRRSSENGKTGPASTPRTFDFLGFTHYMRKRGKRGFRVARKPSRKSRDKFLRQTKEWLATVRHFSVWWQAKILRRKLQGYYRYFGLRHCKAALRHVKHHVARLWILSLRRRSQKHNLWWHRVYRYPWFCSLPEPKLR